MSDAAHRRNGSGARVSDAEAHRARGAGSPAEAARAPGAPEAAGPALPPDSAIYETADTVTVELNVPGVALPIESELDGAVLTVRGERVRDDPRGADSQGRFVRCLKLPCPVDVHQARSRIRNGALLLTFPKVGDEMRTSGQSY